MHHGMLKGTHTGNSSLVKDMFMHLVRFSLVCHEVQVLCRVRKLPYADLEITSEAQPIEAD